MAENKQQSKIAPDVAYQITCPYCFNEMAEGEAKYKKPFPHTAVHFRAETYFANEHAIELEIGKSKLDLEMMEESGSPELKKFKEAERFLLKKDEKYTKFWKNYDGTTEKGDSLNKGPQPWQLPVISKEDGIKELIADDDGFVIAAKDTYGNITLNRVCPYCHNPLPLGFGKNDVKNISIIGITGAGKTVYISQLLKGMSDYVAKSGLNAFFSTTHETDFVQDNKVAQGVPLPDSTSPNRLSQPMFYDIVSGEGSTTKQDTIVLYDIAGENCTKAGEMVKFAKFVENSDGLILLIDPKQLNFIVSQGDDVDVEAPSAALTTLYSVLQTEQGKKSKIPIAVCVSKSDQCFDILPPIASEQVQWAGKDAMGMPTKEFDGKSYNQLSRELTELIKRTSLSVCSILQTNYLNYNFFAVSAIGCECDVTEAGYVAPIAKPEPRRIEEPILWLFKQFGYIKSNVKVKRPFKIQQPDKLVWEKRFLGRGEWKKVEGEMSEFEEDVIRETVIKEGK